MDDFDRIESDRERNEGVDYDRVRTTAGGVCVCGHDEEEHDGDGVCQIRGCDCITMRLVG